MAIEVHGANGYSNDYPVERYLRNCEAAVIYEGTRDIHTLMQADWALGLKKEKPARRSLPPWRAAEARGAAALGKSGTSWRPTRDSRRSRPRHTHLTPDRWWFSWLRV